MNTALTNLLTDVPLESRMEAITALVSSRLANRLGTASVPGELQFIVTEVSIARFNRIGSEGLSSHTVEGETMSWSENDFAPYEDDIQAWIDQQDRAAKGRIRFL